MLPSVFKCLLMALNRWNQHFLDSVSPLKAFWTPAMMPASKSDIITLGAHFPPVALMSTLRKRAYTGVSLELVIKKATASPYYYNKKKNKQKKITVNK